VLDRFHRENEDGPLASREETSLYIVMGEIA